MHTKKNGFSLQYGGLFFLSLLFFFSIILTPPVATATVTFTTAREAAKKISAGPINGSAITFDHGVVVWEYNTYGQCNIPLEAQSNIKAISCRHHCLAIKENGTIVGWGDTGWAKLNIPAGLENLVDVKTGNIHSIVLTADGYVVAWGDGRYGGTDVPPGLDQVVAIDTYNNHCLAIRDDGINRTVVAWGNNTYGQCDVPEGLTDVIGIAAGSYHSLALKADGTVVAWGINDGSSNDKGQCDVPEGLTDVVAISAGTDHSMALRANHEIVIWGDNTFNLSNIPVNARTGVIAIDAGEDYCLALKEDGSLIAWGFNYYKECNIPADLRMTGNLSDLTVSCGQLTPAYDPNVLNYDLFLPHSISEVDLTAVLEDSVWQQLFINGEPQDNGVAKTFSDLPIGTTNIEITIFVPLPGADDPDIFQRTYHLAIHREGPDNTNANLWSITSDTGVLAPAFDPAITAYTVTVPNETTNVELTAIPADSTATVTINEHSGTAGLPYAQLISLEPSENPVNITVAAGDGNTTKTYQVTIIRGPSGNAGLAGLTVDAGTLTPAFDNNTAAYRVENPGAVTSLAVTAALADPEAALTINGEAAEHNVAKTVPLTHGGNLIPLVVTSPNGLYEKAYVLSVNGTVNNANLATLSAQAVNSSDPEHPQELLLTFDPATTSYQLQMENAVESFELTATPSDDKALLLQGETILPSGEARSIALTEGVNEIRILVVAQDASTKAYTLEITRGSALELETTTLPLGVFNAPYATTLVAQGGTLPYTWSISGLPAGLSLNSASGAISGTPQTEGTFALTVTVTDALGLTDQTELSLQINQGCGNGGYLIAPLSSPAYIIGYTENGLPTMTVKDGISGFTEFSVEITPVNGHEGLEKAVFVQQRNNIQLAVTTTGGDFELAHYATAAFNVSPQDIIKVYLIDALTSSTTTNPQLL